MKDGLQDRYDAWPGSRELATVSTGARHQLSVAAMVVAVAEEIQDELHHRFNV